VEDDVVVVTVSGMCDKVFDGFWCGFREEADRDVAVRGVDGGGGASRGFFSVGDGFGIYVAGFLVLDIALRFCDAMDVSCDLLTRGGRLTCCRL
jgi:hypothetical protein